jgi:tetraacyldisaccharide 4'-kinase
VREPDARPAPGRQGGVAGWWGRFARGYGDTRGLGTAVAGLLVLSSVLYGVLASFSLWLRAFRPVAIDVPIISVGNLTVGGTGKTPLVVHLARRLMRRGRVVAVVSRGYGRRGRGTVVVSRGDRPIVPWLKAGDEPYLVALLTKGARVVVSARRSDGIRCAVQKLGADVILLDDAFQHVQLVRDLDIVTADARYPVGNGFLLPGGALREHPLGIGRADLIVATRCGDEGARRIAATIGPLVPEAPIVETRMKAVELWDVSTGLTVSLSEIRERAVLVLSSIAEPASFDRTLERLGIRPAARVTFPDHHRYSRRDLAAIEEEIRISQAATVLTTEKDAVRLSEWSPAVPVVALGIELAVTRGDEHLERALDRALSGGGDDGA